MDVFVPGRHPFAGPLAIAMAGLAIAALAGGCLPGWPDDVRALAAADGNAPSQPASEAPSQPASEATSEAPSETPPDVRVEINVPAFRLTLYRGGRALTSFTVAVGARSRTVGAHTKGTSTPLGRFTVARKTKNPAWYPPAWVVREKGWDRGYVMPPGPENPLGVRWLGLSRPGYQGYGIHGTSDTASLGHAASLGCVRMGNDDVVQVYAAVSTGAAVDIVYRTAEIVRDGDGNLYVALYPDIYRLGAPTVATVRRSLAAAGLEPSLGAAGAWEQAIAASRDRPVLVPVSTAPSGPAAPPATAGATASASRGSAPEVDPAGFIVLDTLGLNHPDEITVYLEGRVLGSAVRSAGDWLLPLTRLPAGFDHTFAVDPVSNAVLFYGRPLAGANVVDGVIQVPVLAMARALPMGVRWTAGDRLDLSW